MRSITLPFTLIFLLFISCITEKKESDMNAEIQDTTVFYFIRHAEKDRSDPENRDPELTEKGLLRAAYWKEVLEQVPLSVVYSTDYKRTLQTAQPVAEYKNLDILIYAPDTMAMQDLAAKHRGKHILVVGHSNTTPQLVNQLLGTDAYQDIDDSNNGNLYIVQQTGNAVNCIVLHPEPTYPAGSVQPEHP